MATSTNLIRTLTIRSKTEGVQDSTSQLKGLAAAGDQVTQSSASTEKATLSVERAFQRLQRQLDASVKSQEQMAKAAQTLERAQAQGLITQQRANDLMDAAAQQYGKAGVAIGDMTKRMSENSMANDKLVRGMSDVGKAVKAANDNMSKSGQAAKGANSATNDYTNTNKLARFELINLSRQIQDVGVSLASGQNAFTVAIQQGSQIFDVFQTSGVTMAGFGKQLLGLISPMLALVGGITLVVGAIALMSKAWSDMAIQADNLSKRLGAPIAQLQELQGAAAIKGIGTDDFVKGMEAFGDQLSLAKRGLGDLKELFRLNGMAVEQDMLPNFLKVADLVQNAKTEVDKLNVLQAAGLPRTQDWVRLMEQGGDAVRKAAQEMGHANVSQDMVDSARKFQEAWDKAWSQFKTGAFAAIGEVLELLGKLATAASSVLDKAGEMVKGILGSAKTRADELAAGGSIEDQLVGPSKGAPLQLTVRPAKPTVTPEDLKAMEQEISLQKQRISLLGDLATSEEKAALARKEIDVARLKGVEISKGEGDAIVKNIELDLKHSAKLKELKEDYKQVEQAITSFGTTLITSMLDGATATQALGKALEALGKQLINIGVQDFAKSISKDLSKGIDSILGGIGGSIAGPLGTAAVGVGVSLIGKLFGKSDDSAQKKLEAEQQRAAEELKRAQEAWAKMTDQVEAFNRMAAGVKIGDLTSQVDALFKAWEPLKEAAKAAQDAAGSAALGVTLIAGIGRLLNEFAKNLPDLISGFGATGPMADAAKSVQDLMDKFQSLNDSIHEFASRTLSDQTQAYADLNDAARKALLALLDIPEPLSETATKLADLNGKAAALTDALVELGLSAEDAAAAVQEKLNVALEKLRGDFLGDLAAQVNELAGGDWINQAADLAKKVAQMRADAASLGVETSLIDSFFVLSAQKIVDSGQLVGDNFNRLQTMLGLAGTGLHEFSAAVEEVAAAAKRSTDEIAKTIQGYQDQLFVLRQDQNTLSGALAVFDQQALRAREDEIAKGGEALAALEELQAQQRFNIIKDFNDKALEAQQKAADDALKAAQQAADQQARILKEAQDFLAGALRRISDWIAHFQASAQSTLPPSQQLSSAQSAFATQFAAATSGDRDALSNITSSAQDVVDAARRYYGSGAAGQTIISNLISQLQSLPAQVSAEQFIVDQLSTAITTSTTAINQGLDDLQFGLQNYLATGNLAAFATALNANFSQLDTNLDGLLDFNEFQQGLHGMASDSALAQMFKTLDTDNSGSISRLELIKASTDNAAAQTTVVATNTDAIETSNSSIDTKSSRLGFIDNSTQQAATSLLALAQISNNTQSAATATAATQTNTGNTAVSLGAGNLTAILTAMANNIGAISSWAPGSNHEQGGLIVGNRHSSGGVGISAEGGEFVMSRRGVATAGLANLYSMNSGAVANDNYSSANIAAIRSLERTLVRCMQVMIETQMQAAGVTAAPLREANKLSRSRRGEKKVA